MRFCFVMLLISFSMLPVYAQNNTAKEEICIAASAETGLYSFNSLAYGGGLALAYGTRTSIGLKASYFYDIPSNIGSFDIDILLRFNLLNRASGPFLQFMGGPVIMIVNSVLSIPGNWGTVSIGLAGGWRFAIGRAFFTEVFVRGGYPYIFGAGLAAGIRL